MIDLPGAHRRRPYGSSGRAGAVTVTACRDGVLVLLIGDLGAADAGQLRRRLVHDLDASPSRVVVDASAATWLGDDVIAVLRTAARHVEANEGDLVVVDPPPALQLLLRRCGLRTRATGIGA